MTTTLKKLLFDEATQLFRKLHGEDLAVKGACLYWARCGIMTLIEHGFTPCIQAGTLMVRMVPAHMDDGKRDMFFGWKWDPGSALSRIQTVKGLLPELHCWVGIVATQQLIDFSAGQIAHIARSRGHDWLSPEPPDFIWCHPREVPEGFFYEPNREATLCAQDFLMRANRQTLASFIEV